MQARPAIREAGEIGPYQILEDLGPAPFGTAWLVADARGGPTAVLKVIPPSRPGLWHDAALWEILLAETAALGRIYHRGLPDLLEISEHEGALWIACAYTEGLTLRALLAQGERPDRATLVDWGCQLLKILDKAHARQPQGTQWPQRPGLARSSAQGAGPGDVAGPRNALRERRGDG